MVVNDLVVQGAEPVVFLDYLAMSPASTSHDRREALRGSRRGLPPRRLRAARRRDGDDAGRLPGGRGRARRLLASGVVDRDHVIEGSMISRRATLIVGLASSGFHSNGYSLVRAVVDSRDQGRARSTSSDENARAATRASRSAPAGADAHLREAAAEPHPGLRRSTASCTSPAAASPGNVPRILPDERPRADRSRSRGRGRSVFDVDPAPSPSCPTTEMLRVFNCGIGMIVDRVARSAGPTTSWIQRLQGTERAGVPDRPPSSAQAHRRRRERRLRASLPRTPGFLSRDG